MSPKKKIFLTDLDERLNQNPEYRKEVEITKPYVNIATELVRIRCEAGLTQAELAEKIGTTKSAISRIESLDYGRVTLTTLQRIAEALGMELNIQFQKKAG